MTKKAADDTEEQASSRFGVRLPPGAMALLDQLIEQGIYGTNAASIAQFLLIQRLDELIEKGRVKLPVPAANFHRSQSKDEL